MTDFMVINYIDVRPYDDEYDTTGMDGQPGDVRYLVSATTSKEFEEDGADASGPVTAERLVHPKEKAWAASESIQIFKPREHQMRFGWLVAPHLLDAVRGIEGLSREDAQELLYGRKISLKENVAKYSPLVTTSLRSEF